MIVVMKLESINVIPVVQSVWHATLGCVQSYEVQIFSQDSVKDHLVISITSTFTPIHFTISLIHWQEYILPWPGVEF